MNSLAFLRGALRNSSVRCLSHQFTPTVSGGARKAWLDCPDGPVKVHEVNARLTDLHVTASALAGLSLNQIEMRLPSLLPREQPLSCPSDSRSRRVESLIVPEVDRTKEILEPVREPPPIQQDPQPEHQVKKYAHRMVRRKKRKIKIHHKKKRSKLHAAKIRKNFLQLTRRVECQFRMELLAKVKVAKKFNAQVFVEEYLEDLHTPAKPLTYHGKRLPLDVVQELYTKDELASQRKESLTRDIFTQEPLIVPGETVADFEARTNLK
ncbi:uncharacterized protein LOC131889444 [Tigriopus californicus]|uniref:uncharacterized protein LOC131889444 n=1 Tax=Tigriopus californicus TaxID=6832 RepID=UPI0027DA9F4D|nr:uncharacterized protein LOC131889444 [Tigriopus californicus]